ncbi:UDP-N-acetylmuramate dehydrogenase [Marinobacter sp.]|uniref:UDP-N-acetylmuramate dehydrogenase n=1 Tax=Marinobacter sp. TaxID=50741 RepID=UPI0019965687|nr:UDP-N-acetylmuramate dehydrogenase [Marinobacter sp.]MBC7192107.1 UDP-N-acetylmuramate dehydrogenase [Marinobacter sp.]
MNALPEIRENVALDNLNTLRVPARARWFCEITGQDELLAVADWARTRRLCTLLLGGGSNLVFTGDFDGLVIAMAMRGRRWESVSGDQATLVLKAGENWHESVLYAASSGFRGIENLALIPGTVGAAPIQNIGAYGVELCDTLESVTVYDARTGDIRVLKAPGCCFGYRDSIFKHESNRYIVLELRLRLSRSRPLSLGYGELADYFSGRQEKDEPTPLEVAKAVMAIRRRKLPDPVQLPNAGSFFKNPVLGLSQWQHLKEQWPEMPGYPVGDRMKVPAAWLIDQSGWRGYRNERVGVHNRQALVLINHSGGTGRDILELAERIRKDVEQRYGITLEREPGIIESDAR